MDEGRKQLHLRPQRDKPLLKYSNAPGSSTTSVPNSSGNHGSNVPGRAPSVALFNHSDLQVYKQQMYSNFVNNYAPVYTPSQMGAGMHGGVQHNNRMSFNYTFLSGPGTPNGQSLTPAHILASAVTPEAGAYSKPTKNPYARPISAQEVLPPEGGIVPSKGPVASAKASGSNSSLSSICSNVSVTSQPASLSPTNANALLQTNSFMRPQSALSSEPKTGNKTEPRPSNSTKVVKATPVATVIPSVVDQSKANAGASKPPLALKPHVLRPPSAQKPAVPLATVNSRPPSAKVVRSPLGETSQRSAGISQTAAARANGTLSGENKSLVKSVGASQAEIAPKTVTYSQASTAQSSSGSNVSYGRVGVQNWVMNRTGSNGSFKSVQVNGASGQGPDAKAANLTNQFVPRLKRPGSSTGSVGSSSSDSSARVRNPNYTPSKPYNEVSNNEITCDGTEGEESQQTESERRTEALNTKIGALKKNVSFSSHAVEISPQMLLDGRVKEMPVTHTLTGTIYYRKSSKAEEVIHTPKKRTVADGAPSLPSKQDESSRPAHLTSKPPQGKSFSHASHHKPRSRAPGVGKKAVTSQSTPVQEEWTDEEEEGEESLKPTGERLPGDGEADIDRRSDGTVDDAFDDDDDDVLDNLEDEEYDGSDVDSEREDVTPNQQAPLRLKSATKRLLGLSISDTSAHRAHKAVGSAVAARADSRPTTNLRQRPVSAVSTISSDSDIQPALMPSLFPNVPPTVNFVLEGEKVEQLPWEIRKMLRWKMSTITPNVVKNCIARSGFRYTKNNHDWIGYWGKHMKAVGFKAIREYQKVNHFPGSFQIGRKDRLWRNLSKMQVHFGKKEFGFFPQTFVLPFDLKQLKRVWEDGGNKQKWIIKPPASARGIGIKVIHKWNQIPKKRPVIVQKYLSHPYLINESKFDMRLYVYVTSYDPLRIYLFDDGLVRFASVKYSTSLKNLNNRYMHLTNYSIQKKSSDYRNNTDENVCQGHKWGIKALWGFLKQRGINTNAIWDSIKDLVVKTIIASEQYVNPLMKGNVRRRYCCHELFGFDVMLDDNLKPWIIEVNISPSLHSNSQLDMNIKGVMMKDLLNLCGFMIPDKNDLRETPSNDQYGSKYVIPSEICMDKRLWPQTMSPDERVKHAYYSQRHNDEATQATILDTLTPEDIRYLIEAVDEDSRKGNFERIFPTANTHKYLRYFESPRYSNLLLSNWWIKFNRMNARGIAYLESLCTKGVHLENPTDDPKHQWAPPNTTAILHRDSRIYSAPLSSKPGSRVLPQLRKNKQYSATSGTSSQSSTPCTTTRSVPASYDPH